MAMALFFRGGCKPVLKGYKKLLRTWEVYYIPQGLVSLSGHL